MNATYPSAFVMGIGTLGPALGIGMIGAAALLAMARNPQNSERIQVAMIIAIAFAEAIAIYALVVALLLKFIP
ncbi:ATP synthase F0 subunit C [Patescibacteria group bacterium]|nr:ATP synthase F0 subunit C [Patescibacteria group bacterium]